MKKILIISFVIIIILFILLEKIIKKDIFIGENMRNSQNSSWQIFRGDQSLSGYANATIKDKLNLIWTFKTESEIKSSPVIFNNQIFIGSSDNYLYSLDLESGKELWKYNTNAPIESPPLIFKNNVYVGNENGDFIAFDIETKKVLWEFQADDKIVGSANFATLSKNNDVVLFGSYDNYMYCVNAKTGLLKWKYETSSYINGTPGISNNQVAFGGCDGHLHIIDIGTGKETLDMETESYIVGSVAFVADYAYFGHYDKNFNCVDVKQKKILWTYKDKAHSQPFISSPAIYKDFILIGGRSDYLYCLNNTGELIWKFKTQDDIDSSPLICNDKVVVASLDGKIYLLDLISGQMIDSYNMGASITSSPAIANEIIVIACENGIVYGFK